MIYTCSHKEYISNEYITYAISGNRGKDAGYNGWCFPALAPKLSFWKIWENNIGKIPEEENNKYYIEQYYEQVLSKLDPEEIYRKLGSSILLCYEDNTQFCHRHIVAAWLELILDVKVPEVTVLGYNVTEVERPKYIKEYLEEVIKEKTDMKGFNSLAALFQFEKSEKIEQLADDLESKGRELHTLYRQGVSYLKNKADEMELKYKEERSGKLESNYKNKKKNTF